MRAQSMCKICLLSTHLVQDLLNRFYDLKAHGQLLGDSSSVGKALGNTVLTPLPLRMWAGTGQLPALSEEWASLFTR